MKMQVEGGCRSDESDENLVPGALGLRALCAHVRFAPSPPSRASRAPRAPSARVLRVLCEASFRAPTQRICQLTEST